MRIAYFDCQSGISGDMVLGALVDLGVDIKEIQAELKKLGLSGFELKIRKVKRGCIAGRKADVLINNKKKRQRSRTFTDIRKLINASGLPKLIKDQSVDIFKRIGVAEAKVHRTTLNKIHFHEVGAVDSIVDIVGGVIGFNLLGVDRVFASSINTGEGTVESSHGILPVPAPATLELLKGIPCFSSGEKKELATPTGVAMIGFFAEKFCSMPLMTIENIGYGAGAHILKGMPNLLRVVVGASVEGQGRRMTVIETNIDDMNPEFYDHVMESLFSAGAVDVFLTPITMKKNRPAVKLSAIAPYENQDRISRILLMETSTFGVRSYEVDRKVLAREIKTISSRYGKVKIKIGKLAGEILQIAPEYEDCKRIAKRRGVPVKKVYDEVYILAKKKYGEGES